MGTSTKSAGDSAQSAQSARVVLIDDSPAVRESTRILLKTVGLDLLAYHSPNLYLQEIPDANCILLDVRMPELSGLEVYRRLRKSGVETPVIFITGHGHVSMAVSAMRDGAFDFLEKPIEDQRLIDAVFAALEHDAARRSATDSREEAREKIARLTSREKGIADMIAEGKSSREIAQILELSVRTVEGYRSRILAKLDADSLAQLIHLLQAAGR